MTAYGWLRCLYEAGCGWCEADQYVAALTPNTWRCDLCGREKKAWRKMTRHLRRDHQL